MEDSKTSNSLNTLILRLVTSNTQLLQLIISNSGDKLIQEKSSKIILQNIHWLSHLSNDTELNQILENMKSLLNPSTLEKHSLIESASENQESEIKIGNLTTIDSEKEIQPESEIPDSQIDLITEKPYTEEEKGSQEENKYFYKLSEVDDRWDFLENIKSFMNSYEHLMHFLLPNLAFQVVQELHSYTGQDKFIVTESISNPSLLMQNLITKLLREAPGAQLLRRMRRKRRESGLDIEVDQLVSISELVKIKNIVKSYFQTIEKFLDKNNFPDSDLKTLYESAKQNYKQFSLGPITVEARLTAVVKNVTESSFKEAEQAFQNQVASDQTKVIYLASTQLMCSFQNLLLTESRLLRYLEELKA